MRRPIGGRIAHGNLRPQIPRARDGDVHVRRAGVPLGEAGVGDGEGTGPASRGFPGLRGKATKPRRPAQTLHAFRMPARLGQAWPPSR
jgi:hypothetical protein